MSHARIVGAGLIGTSIALGLSERGWTIDISDRDEKVATLAKDLLQPSLKTDSPDLVVIATPPSEVMDALQGEFMRYPNATFIDVASIKTKLLLEVERLPALSERFVGTHPMAGREIGGAHSAQADLFRGRAWIITPTQKSSVDALAMARKVIEELGATSYEMKAENHDELMARISHLPQVVSTALATSVIKGGGLDLAGQGLRDMTRLANSDGSLWSEILIGNKEEVSKSIKEFINALSALEAEISAKESVAIKNIFQTSKSARELISGKHGKQARPYSYLRIVIEDRPGQLSNIIADCSEIDANIEDLAIEHSPGQFTGLITLAFLEDSADQVQKHLQDKGWRVHLA